MRDTYLRYSQSLIRAIPEEELLNSIADAGRLVKENEYKEEVDVLVLGFLRDVWLSEAVGDRVYGDPANIVYMIMEGTEKPAVLPPKVWVGLQNMWKAVSFLRYDRDAIVFNQSLVTGLHRLVMQCLTDHPGQLRTKIVSAAGTNLIYTPPHMIERQLVELLALTDNSLKNISTIVDAFRLATWFFVQFLRIHPFQNGNGRLARILTAIMLQRFVHFPVTLISTNYHDHDDYMAALVRAQQHDDYTLIQRRFLESAHRSSVHILSLFNQGPDLDMPSSTMSGSSSSA